jgi:ATP-binding cassette subfamily B protein
MKYNLNTPEEENGPKKKTFQSLKTLIWQMVEEKRLLLIAFIAMIIAAIFTLLGPVIIGHTIDNYVQTKEYHGVLVFSGILLVMYLIAMVAGYLQSKLMGTVGQQMLYNLRNSLFKKLQDLPLDFFNQNKSGDLISRINNDTEKINQFFSQSLMQFVRSILIMIGAAIFLLSINLPLGAAALAPALVLLVFTRFISPWVKKRNAVNLKSLGNLSSEVQESLSNFKVVVAFNRRDYFRKRFAQANQDNYNSSVKAGIANNLFMPVYTLFANIGQMIVLTFGIYLIANQRFTIGLLISFIAYVTSFYNPLRQLASLWANFQVALAAWDRIYKIINMENDMPVMEGLKQEEGEKFLLTFRDVSFTYPDGTEVLNNINFKLEKGKTYAFVGPTGGGKTTTASLIARLYDPTQGTILLGGKDIRSYHAEEKVQKIGFILQEPYLFSGTVRDNILYGNEKYQHLKNGELTEVFHESGLEDLLKIFDEGLDTKVDSTNDGMSLGQKQLLAFMRAVLRKPDLLILDEATANIDTVTEKLLETIMQKLPATTTKVIIAHRLNTIESADEIFFINTGSLTRAGSLKEAVKMLMEDRMAS